MMIGNVYLPGPAEAYLLACACAVDFAIGDPRWLPHPVRLIGAAVAWGETALRRIARSAEAERAAGVLLTASVVLLTWLVTHTAQKFALQLADGASSSALTLLALGVLVLLAAATLALRGLVDASLLVVRDLQRGDILKARSDLSMIVGRDTSALTDEQCAKATIETVAENLSDGVIAPLFYFTLGGLPLAMAYKAVNTLDSMIGYRNDRYRRFGWAAARLDDVANYVPARISGALIVFVSLFLTGASAGNAWRIMQRDGRNHPSPNSGVPEAAIAGALGIRLGGPSIYGGIVVPKPFIGDPQNATGTEKALRAIDILRGAAVCGMLVAVACMWRLS
jgi:adenosylcobinamide-phosphate synthase